MTKLFFCDLETTGTLHWRHSIHQIAGAIEIDGVIKEQFDFKVCPNPKAEIDPQALEVGGVTEEQILSYPHMYQIYTQLIGIMSKYVDRYNKTDKFFNVGYNNASFDTAFLRAWFRQNGDEYYGSWFWSDAIDVRVLAAQKLMERRPYMENFKLKTACKEMGIEVEEGRLHDGHYDISLTGDLYRAVI